MPSLTDNFLAWQNTSAALKQRITAALVSVAFDVEAEADAANGGPANSAARKSWALTVSIDPGREEPRVRWRVLASDAYAQSGELLTDDDLLAVVAASVDALTSGSSSALAATAAAAAVAAATGLA